MFSQSILFQFAAGTRTQKPYPGNSLWNQRITRMRLFTSIPNVSMPPHSKSKVCCSCWFLLSSINSMHIALLVWASPESWPNEDISTSIHSVRIWFCYARLLVLFLWFFRLVSICGSAADPGAVKTNIMREIPSSVTTMAFTAMKLLGVLQSSETGASAIVDAALAPPVSTQGHLGLLIDHKSTSLTIDYIVTFNLWPLGYAKKWWHFGKNVELSQLFYQKMLNFKNRW